MPKWQKLEDLKKIREVFNELGVALRQRKSELNINRLHYSLTLAHAVRQAIHCGYERIAAVELGVFDGAGLFELCTAAEYFRKEFEIEIDVYGFDNATGLPPANDYRDHPEIWRPGQVKMPDPEPIRRKLPDFAHLIIGDVADTLKDFESKISHDNSRLAFVSIDLDYYSSTKKAMQIFKMSPGLYVPALPVYVDDVNVHISYNPWCGEAAAIEEFNSYSEFRKIEEKAIERWKIHNFYVCHILDHPMRTGEEKPRLPFVIHAF